VNPLPTSVADQAAAVRRGDVAPGQLADAAEAAQVAADTGPDPVHAFLAADFAGSIGHSVRDARGNAGRLAGIPVAVKDNLATIEFPTTCGSRILDGYRSPFDASVVRRLREAGALVVGKTNMDEFAMGSSTEHSAFGPTRNPLDRSRVPGGSSGGSAAAVAAGIVPVALGSETGGSVRQPAAFCGIVGIKPTYGLVSRYGLVAFASSLDQVGTFGRTVADAALLLEVVAGHDPLDSTSAARAAPSLASYPARDLDGITVGVPEEYFPDSLDRRVRDLCRASLRRMEGMGAEIREVSLPHTPFAIPTYYIIAPAEASSNLARFDGVRYGARAVEAGSLPELYEATRALFGPEAKRRIMIGTHVLSAGYYDAYYGRAQRVRALIAQDFRYVFDSGVDVIFTPTTPSVAFRIGERTRDPYEMYLSDVFTVTANLAGIPAMSIPIGDVDGLPVGGQLMGDHWTEPRLVRVAQALEASLSLPARART
jgi:aspartyl-tRNA(Asn)/glutamyl-tRNA(Gln) amidotransferase subunit A